MARVIYTEENATHEWLCQLAKQPGEVWIEINAGRLIIVHEFNDLKGINEENKTNPE